jgi:hypothetical protein
MEAGVVLADEGVARDESDKGGAGMARATQTKRFQLPGSELSGKAGREVLRTQRVT